jgi:hypothetical protein
VSWPECQVNQSEEKSMSQLTPDEEKKALDSSPRGTFALLLVFAALMVAGWAFMFFYRFLAHGPVN